jgi:dihydroorotate dehydrogenase
MYKQAEGYERAYAQGAGYYVAGTTTSLPRKGNTKNGIHLPFTPYPQSHSASNWLGLPNLGHVKTANIISSFKRYEHFPIGASVSSDPGMNASDALRGLIDGMKAYQDAGCDFLELNESCPNVPGHSHSEHNALDESLIERLDAIANEVDLSSFPIFVKFSNDTDPTLIKPLISILCDRNFSGINLGNTSTSYTRYGQKLHQKDKKHFDYFTREFGGGLSGSILRESSLNLCSEAAQAINEQNASDEFLIIATGGIETSADLKNALQAGANLAQWYTGYYERFGIDGNKVYVTMYQDLIS